MTSVTDQHLLAESYRLFQSGDFASAITVGRRLLPRHAEDPRLTALLGMAELQMGRADAAIPWLHHAVNREPSNLQLRTFLGFALVKLQRWDEATAIVSSHEHPDLLRIQAFVDQQQGRTVDAEIKFARVVAAVPQDFESWHNLGLVQLANHDLGAAVSSLAKALSLHQSPIFYIGLTQALTASERHAERLSLLEEAVRRFPVDATLLVELGLAQGASGDFVAAEMAYQRALAADPANAGAYLEYAMMLEALNRLEDMAGLLRKAAERRVDSDAVRFARSWLLKRQGRFAEALTLIERSTDVNASRRAQLIGEIHDRLGDVDRAFEAFTEMNRQSAAGPASTYARAQDFPGEIAARLDTLTPDAVARWTPAVPEADPPAPAFILGFPRSGTTLLDTLLMNLPELRVLEERPMVERVEALLGDPARLGSLSTGDVNRLRRAYFDALQHIEPGRLDGRMIVDKFPMHLVRAPLIHRLFPDARITFVERHPCDVVLSCYISRFQTNRAMVQFQDLAATARFYDVAMRVWTRAVELLPLRVHHVRYERMIDDLEGELRPLLAFLDVPWRDSVLDNQASAARRTHIATASYAQVTEPIYSHASGRWERYRQHLEPVLPVLAPWVERLGYVM